MEDDDETNHVLECCLDVEKAIIKTLNDIRPRLIAKYGLDPFDADQAVNTAVVMAAVRMYVSKTLADEIRTVELYRHVTYLLRGFIETWGGLPADESEGDDE